MSVRRIPIFFTFDNNYVNPAAVAFWSLLDRTCGDVFWEMRVLHHDISPENQALLSGIVRHSGKGNLQFIDTGDFLSREWAAGSWDGHQTRSQFTSDTVVRCFGARFFPQCDKIIYSDVDVVFADDISGLWEVDISNAYVAGVKNAFMKFSPHELSHLNETHYQMLKDSYLAGGIWVMNLKKIRDDNLEQRMIEIVNDDSIVKRWNDQDVINIACAGKVSFLPLNYICYPYLRSCMEQADFISHYSKAELYDSLLHPKIIHYAGSKPWNTVVAYDEIWWTIYDYLGLDWDGCSRSRCSSRELSLRKKVHHLKIVRLWLALAICILLAMCLSLSCQ